MNGKKLLYILAFGFLGFIVATLIHGVVELVLLDVIFGDSANASSVWWREWALIHAVGGSVLWTAGIVVGLYAGTRWWDQYGSKPGAFGFGK